MELKNQDMIKRWAVFIENQFKSHGVGLTEDAMKIFAGDLRNAVIEECAKLLEGRKITKNITSWDATYNDILANEAAEIRKLKG